MKTRPNEKRGAIAFLLLYLALRGALLFEPGYADDLAAYRRWAMGAVREGLSGIYRATDIDYPPLYAYVLEPLGHAYAWLSPGAGTRKGGDLAIWTALVKLPPLAFDLATALLLFGIGRRIDSREGSRWRLLLPGAYLANPAVVFDGGYWGHPDSILGFFVLGAFVAVALGRAATAFALLTLGALTKPLAAPLFPLLIAFAWRRGGLRALALGGLASAAVSALVFAPFVWSGDAAFVFARVRGDLDRMPFTAVNAHNLWGLLAPWQPAEEAVALFLTPTWIGLGLFGIAYAATLAGALRNRADGMAPSEAALAAGFVTASFFILATHMHENHLFLALPLLAAALPLGRPWPAVFAALSVAVLLNLVLHDPLIPGRAPFTWGGPTDWARPSHGRSFFLIEWLSVQAATVFTLVAYAGFAWALWTRVSAEGKAERQ